MNKKSKRIAITTSVIATSLILVSTAFASTGRPNSLLGRRNIVHPTHFIGNNAMKPAVVGTVASINGSLITITGLGKYATTTYTVDASKAEITSGMGSTTILSLSNIHVGDTIAVVGNVSGTTVTATIIRDGVGMGAMHNKSAAKRGNFLATPRYVGNILSISGDSFVIQGKSHMKGTISSSTVSYTVNTNSATVFMKNGKLDSLTDLAVGNMVMVAGTLDSTTNTITATGVNVVGK